MTPPVPLVPLADVIRNAPEDQEPAPGFVATLHGEDVDVTAVLERTAVVTSLRDRWADKQVVRLTDVLVDPAVVTWRPKEVLAWRRQRIVGQREAQRAASDRRARADQARQAATEAAARQTTALQRAARPRRMETGATISRPLAGPESQRPITALVAVAAKRHESSCSLAAQLRDAHQRIAQLEAELERHLAAERNLLRRVEVAVGRRAA